MSKGLRSRILSAAASCALLALPAAVYGSSSAIEIRSAYGSLQKALFKNDAAALSALLAPNFQERNANGSVETRDAFVKEQTATTPGLTVSAVKIDITRLSVHGNNAQANASYIVTGTYAEGGTAKSFRGELHGTDEWTFVGSAWKLRQSTVHDDISYLDGKIVERQQEQIAPSKAAIDELRAAAVVLPTLALDADPDRLAAIGSAIGNARIVGMGEGSHGSSEFFAFKDRLFKYLVERKGFTVFAMEAAWGAGLNVDRYIKSGSGTARQAVASLGFWTWDTSEVVDLVQWMHDYNGAPGKHPILSFVGVDMQDPMGAIGYLADFVTTHDPRDAVTARSELQCVANTVGNPRAKPADDCRQQVAAVGRYVSSAAGSPDASVAQVAVTNVLQYLDLKVAPPDATTQTRDKDMATNLEWAASYYPDAKIALWAHNGHVGTTPELSYRPMGSYLRQTFGSSYYVIGQTFGGGTVRAIVKGRGLQSVSVPAVPGDTLGALFAPLKAPAFLDLRGLRAGSALHTFFSTQHGIEEIGAVADPERPDERMAAVIPNSFDGLVYMPISTATTSGIALQEMQRQLPGTGADWKSAGVGFDDVKVSATPTGATISNTDGLNATVNAVLRHYDAAPYAGQTIEVTAEIRIHDLLGFAFPFAAVKGPDASVIARSPSEVVDATRTGIWIPVTLTLKVSQHASVIDAGLYLEGLGSAEIRNLSIHA